LNGYDLAALVRSEFPKVKILLTSGYASDVVTNRMGGTAAYRILHKPYRHSDLAERLQALL
ncbi:MAG: hybrid sensor histidine kinase/response regulator, partial [Planctomycetota bacterium]